MPITMIDDSLLEAEGRFHVCLEDVPNLDASQMKEFMDYIPRRVVIPKLNEFSQSVYTKAETDSIVGAKADVQDVLSKREGLEKISSLLIGTAVGDPAVIDDIVDYPHTLEISLENKNLIPCIYPGKTQTVNGITFAMNNFGGIELFGTSTANATFTVYFKDDKLLPDGLVPGEKYTVYCESDGEVSGCSFIVNYYTEPPKGANYSSWVSIAAGGGKSKTSVLPENAIGVRMYINVSAGQTFEGQMLYPMIERGSVATGHTDWVPSLSGIGITLETEGENFTEYSADEDGILSGITSVYPGFKLHSGVAGVLVRCRYRRDITKAFESLLKKIENGG